MCDQARGNIKHGGADAAVAYCIQHRMSGAERISKVLDKIEPDGPRGQVQIGYLAPLRLLSLYRKVGGEWIIDKNMVDLYVDLIEKIKRPVVVYLAANHFDSNGALQAELIKDKDNLQQLSNGTPPTGDYFGTKIYPFTLLADERIPVNHYRYEALRYVAMRLLSMSKEAQERIVAITLAGELHQMYSNFRGGMGEYQHVRVTDYSPASILGFREWLKRRYGSTEAFNRSHGSTYRTFSSVEAPFKDIRTERLDSFFQHYDSFAAGRLPISGWLWDPDGGIGELELFIDGSMFAPIDRELDRLDVYRAIPGVLTPNVGFRYDLDFTKLQIGHHLAQVVATARGKQYLVGEAEFAVVGRNQGPVPELREVARLSGLKHVEQLPGVRAWLDLPKSLQSVFYNPLAKDWDEYRQDQVTGFLTAFYSVAKSAGLPTSKLFSHQIIPEVNSTWNPGLFASDGTMKADRPWHAGVNMYGGATNSNWMRSWIMKRGLVEYGSPEFHPQQWKKNGVAYEALLAHYRAGARFICPYYISVIPDEFKALTTDNSEITGMELREDNPREGSDQFYRAIVEFAKF